MQTIRTLTIGDRIHLRSNPKISFLVTSISIENDVINNKYSQMDIVELNTDKQYLSIVEAQALFYSGTPLCVHWGGYEDDEESDDYGLALYTEISLEHGDEFEESYDYFLWI
jgi:hypothetical protein